MPQSIAAAADLLAKAERPVIVAGDAVAHSGALAELVRLAEALGAPAHIECVASTAAFPTSHPLFRGAAAARGESLGEDARAA